MRNVAHAVEGRVLGFRLVVAAGLFLGLAACGERVDPLELFLDEVGQPDYDQLTDDPTGFHAVGRDLFVAELGDKWGVGDFPHVTEDSCAALGEQSAELCAGTDGACSVSVAPVAREWVDAVPNAKNITETWWRQPVCTVRIETEPTANLYGRRNPVVATADILGDPEVVTRRKVEYVWGGAMWGGGGSPCEKVIEQVFDSRGLGYVPASGWSWQATQTMATGLAIAKATEGPADCSPIRSASEEACWGIASRMRGTVADCTPHVAPRHLAGHLYCDVRLMMTFVDVDPPGGILTRDLPGTLGFTLERLALPEKKRSDAR